MNIIKLNAIESTNSYLKKLCLESEMDDYTVVTAEYQTSGRGQMGTVWQSEKGKNMMFSMLIKFEDLPISFRFYISMAVSLGVITTLNNEFKANFKIKWPNDIMSDNDKVAGVLIENTFRGNFIGQSIIGIGLNVNQMDFPKSIKNATSLLKTTNQKIDRDILLLKLIKGIQSKMLLVKEKNYSSLKNSYLKALYGYKVTMSFIENNSSFKGEIIGVAEDGKLEILTKNKTIRKFGLKEIKFTNS
jgi:BirA family biotin operon repressor/biotin-[acetyl-CoA-carboxylase] ligase